MYDAATYPYFLLDADGDGKGDTNDQGAARGYNKWTPRLLKAAYNYQVSVKDPGAFAHGNKYIVQLLFDSIEDLGGDVSKLARTDAGHFAGDTMPFRDWDAAISPIPLRPTTWCRIAAPSATRPPVCLTSSRLAARLSSMAAAPR